MAGISKSKLVGAVTAAPMQAVLLIISLSIALLVAADNSDFLSADSKQIVVIPGPTGSPTTRVVVCTAFLFSTSVGNSISTSVVVNPTQCAALCFNFGSACQGFVLSTNANASVITCDLKSSINFPTSSAASDLVITGGVDCRGVFNPY